MKDIELEHIKKKFKVYYDKGQSLKEKLLFRNRSYYEDRWVLNDISLVIKQGEAVGLIGENGSGKSTLLKLLTRIMYPDAGEVRVSGRVSSLIELGAGFHPDMSGRENIYTNASIFGLGKKEIDGRIDSIIRFSELEEFIDNPVRTYSSGMYMRLAFSVAINVDADILLIDEILAVGDENFQQKCYKKLIDIKKSGVTIVIVSHSLDSIKQICNRTIWLSDGKIMDDGTSFHIIHHYLKFMEEKRLLRAELEDATEKSLATLNSKDKQGAMSGTISADYSSWGNKAVVFREVYLRRVTDGKETDVISANEPFYIEFEVFVQESQPYYNLGVGIAGSDGRMIFGLNSDMDSVPILKLSKHSAIRFFIEGMDLLSGEYQIHASIGDGKETVFDWYPVIKTFRFESTKNFVGIQFMSHSWEVKPLKSGEQYEQKMDN